MRRKAEQLAAEERADRIKKAMKAFADYQDADIAKVARVTLAEVQRARGQA